MIVKGHDYANVTLVGILAADLSLHEQDFRSGEKTFQLLCQAAGRAGRGDKEGMLSSRPIRRSIIQLQQQRSIRMRTFLRKSTLTVS